jgi:hypothetical protein
MTGPRYQAAAKSLGEDLLQSLLSAAPPPPVVVAPVEVIVLSPSDAGTPTVEKDICLP